MNAYIDAHTLRLPLCYDYVICAALDRVTICMYALIVPFTSAGESILLTVHCNRVSEAKTCETSLIIGAICGMSVR